MPASSIFDLLDFATQIEGAAKTVLESVITGVTPTLPDIQVNVTRDSDTKLTPRFDLMFALGNPILQYGAIGQASPKQVPVAYTGVLTAMAVTTRPTDNALMSPIHGLMRGIAMYTFSAQAKVFNDTNLPYLQILEILPIGIRPQMQENKEQDMDEMQFGVKFSIKSDAWPETG